MRETVVEKYLHREVEKAGGTTRKFSSATRKSNPDRIVIWPVEATLPFRADIDFVELKSTGKKARAAQAREHKRLRDLGCKVYVIDTKAKVDEYVKGHRQ